jgi:hypothetical protein
MPCADLIEITPTFCTQTSKRTRLIKDNLGKVRPCLGNAALVLSPGRLCEEMARVFGHQDMGEQSSSGAALGNWPVRGGHIARNISASTVCKAASALAK